MGRGIKIDRWIEETVSSRKNLRSRKLWALMCKIKGGDSLIVSELSRLGRNMFQIVGILNFCMERQIKLRTIKENYELGNNIASKVLAFAFGLAAEIERELISQRTREALMRRKSEGKALGRPRGQKSVRVKLSKHEDDIISLINEGVPKARIAKKNSTWRAARFQGFSPEFLRDIAGRNRRRHMLTENGNPNLWSASSSKTRARACASAKIRKKNSARGKNRPRQTCAGARRFKSARRGASVRRAPRRYRLFCAAGCAFAQANIGLARGRAARPWA